MDKFRLMIERGDVEGVRGALQADSSLANRPVRWHLNRWNESDPLHYVADSVGQGWLTNAQEAAIAQLLLEHGALIDGSPGKESPLIAAVSLGADKVARLLIARGANLEATSIYASRALHWAAWTGESDIVELLIDRNVQLEIEDTEFGSTPLYWAVHGYSPGGPAHKKDQLGAARMLMEAGANVHTANSEGRTALDLARSCEKPDMHQLLLQFA